MRVFVTGTDTGVGKTVVSACLVRLWGAHYWKPVQTGDAEDEGDTATVMRLAGVSAGTGIRAALYPGGAAVAAGGGQAGGGADQAGGFCPAGLSGATGGGGCRRRAGAIVP